MKKDVTIRITGNQYRERNENFPGSSEDIRESDVVIQEFSGTYYDKDGMNYILYEEINEDDPETVKVTLKYDGTSMEITKRGLLNSRMVFKRGESFKSDYVTPFGTFTLGIFTKKYTVSSSTITPLPGTEESFPEAINLHAVYDMEINDEFASENEISVDIVFI